jgi:ankyrin repeat protein
LLAFDAATLPRRRAAAQTTRAAPASGAARELVDAVLGRDGSRLTTLLGAGADPNAVDEHGLTPLMYAATLCEDGMVKRLLEAGADVAAADSMGRTAWDYKDLVPDAVGCWGRAGLALIDAWKKKDAESPAAAPASQ